MPITVNLNGQSGSYVGGTLLDISESAYTRRFCINCEILIILFLCAGIPV